jgi:hypothetical protein
MRIILAVLFVFLSCAFLYAQDKNDSTETKSEFNLGFDDPCGSPLEESQTYAHRQGKIIKIIDSNKIIFEQNSVWGHKDKEKFTLTIVGIDANQNKKGIKDFLVKNVLNQSVLVVGNTKKDSDKKFGAVITLFNDEEEDIDELNIYLLEKGIAKYKPFESANLVSMVIPCRLQRAEVEAKEAKLGIWAK